MGSTNDSSANITLPTSVWVTDTQGVRKYLDAPSEVTAAASVTTAFQTADRCTRGSLLVDFFALGRRSVSYEAWVWSEN